MLPAANQHAADFAWRRCKTQVAGSDAHALASVGTTYTEVPGARNKEEFFAGLRAGYGRLGGESGGYWKLTRDILLLCREMMREDRWTMLLAPLSPWSRREWPSTISWICILSAAGAQPSILRSRRAKRLLRPCRRVRNSWHSRAAADGA